MNTDKPTVRLLGQDGNIYNLMVIARRALREANMDEQVVSMIEEVENSDSYNQALSIIGKYVEIE
ncbi:hypothetical protein [Thermoactinomyces sp. DSM 45892]|uniref:hypothetical protein n=1 Tax=Thermoactinomyces sp. DSM 45892 TaxID=1882753 RepID=UPI00089ADCA1|nr:hypothetical protein [Thermoactinomyces sp. DSM 45892]SDX94359.1 hypothetical protein SAMN05444416_10168 [Thermoactinomyces sp. DSM 45892]